MGRGGSFPLELSKNDLGHQKDVCKEASLRNEPLGKITQ